MLSTSGSTSIARPAAEVFAFIADVRNDPRWHTDVLAAKLLEGTAIDRHSIFEIETKPVMGVSGGTVAVSQYAPQGLMRAMAPFMGGMMRRRNDAFLANLRRLLEDKPERSL